MLGTRMVMETKRPHLSFSEIILERSEGSPRDPIVAAQSFVSALACELIRREAGSDRAEMVVGDFTAAVSGIVQAAMNGATYLEQAEILERHWRQLKLPAADHRKRRVPTGPDGWQLRVEYTELHPRVMDALRDGKRRPFDQVVQILQGLAPDKTAERTLRSAARETPSRATHILLGKRHGISADTVKNRINAQGEHE